MNNIITEFILGSILALKIPILWHLKLYSEIDDFIYLLGWCLYSLGLLIGKNEKLGICLGFLSNCLLSLSYNSSYNICIAAYLLSMISFGYSLGPFYFKNSYIFYLGSIVGCFIGALCYFCDLWLDRFNFLLYLLMFFSILQNSSCFWLNKLKNKKQIPLLHNYNFDDLSINNYPPHILGVIIICISYFISFCLISYLLFIAPILFSDNAHIYYLYLLYGIINVIYYLGYGISSIFFNVLL